MLTIAHAENGCPGSSSIHPRNTCNARPISQPIAKVANAIATQWARSESFIFSTPDSVMEFRSLIQTQLAIAILAEWMLLLPAK
jgi:hypothetical protein